MSKPSYPVIPWTLSGKVSGQFHLDGNQLVGFVLPATIASTAITFNMATSRDASPIVWVPVNDSSGSVISFTG